MNKTLTIIIPTYNMERYLDRCLSSLILEQVELMEQLEIIVVIDGAIDKSSQIAHVYMQKYPGTFIVIDKENGNYGSCINRGLKEATGKYIKVLDADDYYNTNSLRLHIELLKTLDVDLILTSYVIVDNEGLIKNKKEFAIKPNKVFDFDSICLTPDFINAEMHSITYKTENLKRIDYRQTEGISYTDQEWIFLPMTTVQKVVYQPIFLYNYLLGREGQTMQSKILDKNISHQVLCALNRLKELNRRNLELTPNLNKFLFYNLGRVVAYVYRATILRGLYDIDKLKDFDVNIKNLNPQFYNYLGDASLKFGIKFKYIWYFRKKRKRIPYILRNLYVIMHIFSH